MSTLRGGFSFRFMYTLSMTTYSPHFDIDFSRGLIGEDLVKSLPEAIKDGTIEVKTDYRAQETGNFYIETWQYSKQDESNKKQSGINITTATFWAFVIPQTSSMFLIRTDELKSLMRENDYRETRQPQINAHTNASIGRLVPVIDIASKMLDRLKK
jgi:hypothetical protein